MNKKYDILIFLILVYCIVLYIKPRVKKINKYRFKTGDIILSHIYHVISLPFRFFTKYIHSALIICIFDKVYVLDIYPYDDVRIITLDKFMETYENIYILSLKYRYSKKFEHGLFKNLKCYLKLKFPMNLYYVIHPIQNYIKSYIYNKNEKIPKRILCSEFIYYIFENIGLIKETYYLKTSDEMLKWNTHKFIGYYNKYDNVYKESKNIYYT
jgi:hypothetical protein